MTLGLKHLRETNRVIRCSDVPLYDSVVDVNSIPPTLAVLGALMLRL
jgi:hypothetical protein